MLLDENLLIPRSEKGAHLDHSIYSNMLWDAACKVYELGNELNLYLPSLTIPAMVQHDAQHGAHVFVDTMSRRANRMRTFLSGPDWKVLVWGAAVPWKAWVYGRELRESAERLWKEQLRSFGHINRPRVVGGSTRISLLEE